MGLDESWWASIHDFDSLLAATAGRLERFGARATVLGVVDAVGEAHFVATGATAPQPVIDALTRRLEEKATEGDDRLSDADGGVWVVVPLAVAGRAVGGAAWLAPDEARADESLGSIRDELALAIDVVAARYGRRRLRVGLAAVRRVSARLSGALTDSDIAANASTEAIRSIDASACGVYRLLGDELVLVQPEPSSSAMPAVVPLGAESPISDCVRNGEIIMRAMRAGGDLSQRSISRASGQQAWLALPLLVDGRVAGSFALTFDAPRSFTPDELALVATIADQTAQALERTRLQGELEATRIAQSERRFRDALDAMVDLVTIESAIRDESGRIVDFRIDYMNRTPIDVAGRQAEALTGRTVLDAYPAMEGSDLFQAYIDVVETGEPAVIEELPYVDTIDGQEVSGYYSVHLAKFGDGLIISARDIAGMRREHASLLLLQQAISPTVPHLDAIELHGIYEPAGDEARVGGDWFDAVALDDGSVGLIVGDVAGHGLPAAALMAQLRHALRAYLVHHMTPAEALSALNRLARHTDGEYHATCLAAIYDPATRRLFGASAGHLPYVVVRSGTAELADVNVGVPIGVRDTPRYDSFEAVLEAGDTVLLYTDGLIERRTEPIDAGFARLLEIAAQAASPVRSLADVCEAIARDVTPPGPASDDRALLALRLP